MDFHNIKALNFSSMNPNSIKAQVTALKIYFGEVNLTFLGRLKII